MKYLLVVGFSCDVYRREPRARIFVGDRLVDEFCIKHNVNSEISEFIRKKLHLDEFKVERKLVKPLFSVP